MPSKYSVEEAAKATLGIYAAATPRDATPSRRGRLSGPPNNPLVSSSCPTHNGTASRAPPTVRTLSASEEPAHKPRRWRQHLAALLAALSAVSVGYVDAWTANALPFLQAPPKTSDSTVVVNVSLFTTSLPPNATLWTTTMATTISDMIPAAEAITDTTIDIGGSIDSVVHGITAEEASWLSSLVPIGAMFGSIPAGILADKLGRKITLLYMILPCLVSWVIILFGSHSLIWLFLSRTIQGVVMGIVLVVVPLYNEEISEVEVRGAIGVYQNMMVTVGILVCYVVGAFVPYRLTAMIPCAVPICMLVSFIWMPESPVYLLSKGRVEEALKGMQWLRRENRSGRGVEDPRHCSSLQDESAQGVGMELAEMSTQTRQTGMNQQSDAQIQQQEARTRWLVVPQLFSNAFSALTKRPTAFPLAVVFALMSFRQLTGIHAVVFYTVEIFSGARSSLPHAYEAIVIGAVEVAATCAASRLVDRVGRRPLLLTSGAGTAACHAGLALYFYCLGAGVQLTRYSWLPLVLLSLFIVLHACGFGPLPWFMMAELTPTDHKNWATGVTGFLNWGSMFLVLKLFPTLTEAIGDCFTFAIFSFNCAAACCFVYFLVPETKGKTLEEIQEEIAASR